MNAFAAGMSEHPVPAEAVGEAAGQVLDGMGGARPDLAVLFLSPHYVGAADEVAGALRSLLDPGVLLGCTTMGVIGGGREVEDGPGISVWAASLPGARLEPVSLAGVPAQEEGLLMVLADPFSFPADDFLEAVNEERPGLQVIGGLASAARGPGGNRLVLDGAVTSEGAVGVVVQAPVEVRTVVSQGCRPVGKPFVVTRSERNVIYEMAGEPAAVRLQEMVESLAEDERLLLRNGVHVGIVVDEHQSEFGPGDFLIRNVTGLDRETGAMAVGDLVEVGQTVQFHLRDAASADDDLRGLLAGHSARGALLFTCNGRGRHMFGVPDHDASVVEELLGPLPLAGMFCGGELGPVGGRNFLHGFTASLVLFA